MFLVFVTQQISLWPSSCIPTELFLGPVHTNMCGEKLHSGHGLHSVASEIQKPQFFLSPDQLPPAPQKQQHKLLLYSQIYFPWGTALIHTPCPPVKAYRCHSLCLRTVAWPSSIRSSSQTFAFFYLHTVTQQGRGG